MSFEETISKAVADAVFAAFKQLPAREAPELMTISQVAKYAQVTEAAIHNWIRRGENDNPLPAQYFGSDPRFSKEEVDAWSLREAERRARKRKAA